MKNKQTHVISMVILIIAVTIGSFFCGTKYQQNKTVSNFRQQIIGSNGQRRELGQGVGQNAINNDIAKNRGQIPGFRQTVGEIISLDDKTLTIKMADGSSKIVLISDTTKINQSTAATKTDLKVGIKIMVNGETNSDGSVTSRNIEINPAFATITPTLK